MSKKLPKPISTEEVKRLMPSKEVLRELYLKSGNQCAFPGCTHLMMDSSGDFIGQICHIEAAEPGGERFNPGQSNEERRAFLNLMLMCHAHHKKTNNVSIYPVDVLQRMKRDHENKFSDIISKLENSIGDLTVLQDYTYAENCKRLVEFFNWRYDDEMLKGTAEEVNSKVDSLRKLPINTRNIFSIVLNRSSQLYWGRGVTLHEIKEVTGLGESEVKKHLNLLNKYGFLSELEMDDGIHELVVLISDFSSGWPFWEDLKKFCNKEEIEIDEFIVQLNFKRLD